MRNDIDKNICHFFMVINSSLMTLILQKISWGVLLMVKLKFLIDYVKKNQQMVVTESFNFAKLSLNSAQLNFKSSYQPSRPTTCPE